MKCALWVGTRLLRLAGVVSVALFDATEDSGLEMLMLEKNAYTDRALAWSCRVERIMYLNTV